MRVSLRLLPLVALLAMLAGCATPQRVVLMPAPEPVVPAPPEPPEVTYQVVEVTPEPDWILPPAATIAPFQRPAIEWIDWGGWAQANGLRLPTRVDTASAPRFALGENGNRWLITIGQQYAAWNGLNCWLGYPPRITNGQPFVHAIDLEKTIAPLALPWHDALVKRGVVVVDPGHGGENPGSPSVVSKAQEKEFTLDWALRLRPLLESNGWTVVLTRTNDVDLALSNRVALADHCQADLFISLHFNSVARHAEQQGLETYCLTPAGLPSSLLRDPAEDLRGIHPNNNFDVMNLQWAVRLHEGVLKATGMSDRGVRRARFMGVLRNQTRPAVLIEGGYLSNPSEARHIGSGSFRQRLAEGIAKALGGWTTSDLAREAKDEPSSVPKPAL